MFQNEAANVYSQHGEDGIIQSILSKLKANALSLDFWCCEFGAWDGKYLSNTFNLIENYNYKSVLIEPDPSKFAELTINMENFPDQHLFNQFVYLNTKSNLESFLLSAKAPKNLDLLSIDVDGMDYWIFESLKEFRPKIICIEYNHSIPFNVSYIQEKSFQIKQGSSAKAIMELGNQKGYTVVAISRSNLILLDSNLAKLIGCNLQPKLEVLAPNLAPKPIYIFSGYDGSIITSGNFELLWHGLFPEIESLQYLPKYLRHFPDDYGKKQRYIYMLLQARNYKRKYGLKKTLERVYGKLRNRSFK